MMSGRHRHVAGLILAVLVLAPGAVAGATIPWRQQAEPRIEVEPAQARPGEVVTVRLVGWRSVAATVAVCGNLAQRGAPDCDLRRAQGVPLVPTGGTATAQLILHEPSVPCPCVVRAASGSFDEVATAPIDVVGAPAAPVVGPVTGGALVSLAVDARRAPRGVLATVRGALGGPVRYEAEVAVRNLASEPLHAVRLSGSATRSGREVASFGAGPLTLQPGERRVHREVVEIPAPGIGAVRWRATASGAGPTVDDERTTHHTPILLLLAVAVLVGDVLAIVLRHLKGRGSVFHGPHREDNVEALAPLRARLTPIVARARSRPLVAPSRRRARGPA